MANELRINLSVSFEKGGASISKTQNPVLTVSGDQFAHGVQNIGTSETTLSLVTGMGTLGYVFLHNLDDTNYVEFGSATGELGLKLKPGEVALFRTNGSAIYAQANTAACDVEYMVIED